jgi:hypothetical protein
MRLLEARRLVDKWQQRLRLKDWDIKVRFAGKNENEDYWGLVHPHAHTKSAEIVLAPLNRYAHEDRVQAAREFEVTIVHELNHLHHAPFQTKERSALEIVEENIVDTYARLLVAMEYGDESILGRKLSRNAALNKKGTQDA